MLIKPLIFYCFSTCKFLFAKEKVKKGSICVSSCILLRFAIFNFAPTSSVSDNSYIGLLILN